MKRFLIAIMLIFSYSTIFPIAGELDDTFSTDGYLVDTNGFEASIVAIQSDGKVVVTGVDATGDFVYVARYTTAGVLDTTFSTDGYVVDTNGSAAHGIAIQSDGKIVVAGIDATGNCVYVARYTTAGELDTTFSTDGYVVDTNGSAAYDIAIQSDGKIVVVGIDPTADSTNSVFVARYTTAGELDTTFNTTGYVVDTNGSAAYAVAIQSDGKIVVAGTDAADNSVYVARYTTAGVLDTTFNTTGYVVDTNGGAASGVVIQSDNGKIVVTGVDSTGAFAYIARYTAAGELDTTFSTDGYVVDANAAVAYGAIIQCDGKIVIVGQDTSFNSVYIARYLSNGLPDTIANDGSGFNQSGTPGYLIDANGGAAYGIVMQIDGKIVVAGQNTSFLSAYVARYDAFVPGTLNITFNQDGTDAGFINLTTELGAGTNVPTSNPSKAIKILQLSDGSYLVATDDGTDTYINKFTVEDIVVTSGFGTTGRLKITGKINVSDLFLDQTGALIVVGGAGASGSNAGWIKRYSTAGILDTTFAVTDVLDNHTTVRQQSNGRIIVAGMEDNKGMLIAYNPITGAVDISFGDNGRCQTGAYTSNSVVVNSMVIKSDDDTIFGIENDSTVEYSLLFAVDQNGTFVTSTGDLTGGTSACDPTSNHLVIDADGNLVVISAMSASPYSMFMSRYSYDAGVFSLVSSQFLTLLAASTGLTHPIVTSMIIDLNGKFVVTGYDATGSTPCIMRVLSDLSGLDTTFNTTGVAEYNTITNASGSAVQWYDAIITAEGLIIVVGYATVAATNTPYIANFYGDNFIEQYTGSVTAGTPGTIDTTFHTVGSYNIGTLDGTITNSQPKAVMTTAVGGHYITFDNGVDASQLIRTLSDDSLDTAYSADGVADVAPQGVQFMMMDGLGRIILSGSGGSSQGWIQRYTTDGAVDTTFGIAGLVQDGGMDESNAVVEQTLGRYVVAGKNSASEATGLRAYTDLGVLDVTFNSTGQTPGEYNFDENYSGFYSIVADEYDRLLAAYKNGSNVDVIRFTSNGELDTTFGTSNSGIISSALSSVGADASSVRLLLDDAGRIIVTTVNSAGDGIEIAGYDNGIAALGNGAVVYAQASINLSLTGLTITTLVAVEDENVLIGGYESGNNAMWVARITNAGALDVAEFNPEALGGAIAGVMKFTIAGGAQDTRILTAMAIKTDGRISLVGYENVTATDTPFLARAYNAPYQIAIEESPNSEPVGTRDITFGVTTDADDRIAFYALADTDNNDLQKARALALQGYNRVVVALDGIDDPADSTSRVFLNRFNIDGLLDTTFNTTGQVQLPHVYENEYVKDAFAFVTPEGVNKAIIAGYAVNSVLSVTTSWLMQYDLDSVGVDSAFGGIDNDASGTVSGDIQKFNTIARQASGRVVGAGINFDGTTGMILGYTPFGKLDKSFGSDGYYATASATGIYSHAIDSQDRVVFAYSNAGTVVVARLLADGSGLDTTFGGSGSITTSITSVISNDQIRIALDSNDDIYVAAVNGGGLGVQYDIRHYGEGGGLAVSNGIGTGLLGGITELSLARLLVDTQGKVTIIGADNDAVNDNYLIVKLNTDFSMDTAVFNGLGYLKFKVNSSKEVRQATTGLLHADGRVIVAGYEEYQVD